MWSVRILSSTGSFGVLFSGDGNSRRQNLQLRWWYVSREGQSRREEHLLLCCVFGDIFCSICVMGNLPRALDIRTWSRLQRYNVKHPFKSPKAVVSFFLEPLFTYWPPIAQQNVCTRYYCSVFTFANPSDTPSQMVNTQTTIPRHQKNQKQKDVSQGNIQSNSRANCPVKQHKRRASQHHQSLVIPIKRHREHQGPVM